MGFNSAFKGLNVFRDYFQRNILIIPKISLVQNSHHRNASTNPLGTCGGSLVIHEAHSGNRCVRALDAKNTACMKRFPNAVKMYIYMRGLVSCLRKITLYSSVRKYANAAQLQPTHSSTIINNLLLHRAFRRITSIINQQFHLHKFHIKTLKITPTCFDLF